VFITVQAKKRQSDRLLGRNYYRGAAPQPCVFDPKLTDTKAIKKLLSYIEGNNEIARGRKAVTQLGRQWFAAGCNNEVITLQETRRLSDTSALSISHYEIDFPDETGVIRRRQGRLLDVMVKGSDGKWHTVVHFYAPKN
jgi:hypothetical protein